MEDSTQEVVKGSQLADEAGRSLNTIYSAVERQAKMIENIAHAANEQSSVSESVAVAMSQILEITRQTDAGTQEAAISVSYLADLAEQLRSSVSTFRLPDQTNEMVGSFASIAPVAELPPGNDGQIFPPSLVAGVPDAMDSEWGQHFAANFPPLPEPSNSDSLVALSPRPSEQHAFMNQQDFGNQPAWGGQSLGNQPQRNQQYFSSQQYYQNQSSSSGQHVFGNAPHSGSQQDFGSIGGFERHQSPSTSGQQQLGAMAGGFGTQNSSGHPQANQIPFSPILPPSGQPASARLRRQARPQQGQSPFNQDQIPFPDNG
jgi:hypothetical protein